MGSNTTWIKNRHEREDFPGSPVVKNPPCSAEDMDSMFGQGTKIPHAAKQLSSMLQLESLCAAMKDPE